MKPRNMIKLLITFVVVFSLSGFAPVQTVAEHSHSLSPFLKMGPKAIPHVSAAPSDQQLFTCQLGLNPDTVCYDPFQIRHAHQIDTLIDAGYTGKGNTIVIIDAFQSPTLKDDLDTFDSTYALPSRSKYFKQV